MARRCFSIDEETQPFTSPRTTFREIVNALSDCDSVLDVGCGRSSPLRFLRCKRLVGIDAYEPDVERARLDETHDEVILGDCTKLEAVFRPGDFEACVALDLIEHLEKEQGFAFLKTLESIAQRKVVIFTPNGFLPQSSEVPGDFQAHLSGWEPDEMRSLGYEVLGLDGFHFLRGERHRLRFRPPALWAMVSWLSQHAWCRSHPDAAAAILCIKNIR